MKIGSIAGLIYNFWEIKFEEAGIYLLHSNNDFIAYQDIKFIGINKPGLFFATGKITTKDDKDDRSFPGLSVGAFGTIDRRKRFESSFYKNLGKYFTSKLNPAKKRLEEAFSKLKNLENADSYISTEDVWDFCNIPEQVVDCIEHTLFGRSFNALSPKLISNFRLIVLLSLSIIFVTTLLK